jgi:5'-deoxynucleotidase YfbR-like HD superfamily hydrolase
MDLIKMFSMAQAMASLARYSQTRLMAPENVLQHTGFVALASYFMGLELNSVAKTKSEAIPIDDLLSRAVVHDLEEVAVGDIARPTKYHSEETEAIFAKLKDIAIRKVVTDLHLELAVGTAVLHTHELAKEGRAGFIVDLADKAAVIYKLWDECLLRNNHTIIKIAVGLRDGQFIPKLREHMQHLAFNKEQAFYLHDIINTLMEILGMVIAKKNHVHGIVKEGLPAACNQNMKS